MSDRYEIVKLKDVAEIIISGVDKKTKPNETPVRLCNFTDVYHNWCITKYSERSFMNASANANEIKLYKIHKGQVAITKDSETRDDIGISTYIAEDFSDVLLGYHCALITPDDSKLDGRFLNAYLKSRTALKHFEMNASGSGQRYTLTLDSIGELKIPLLPLDEQKQIGDLLDDINEKIELNRESENASMNLMNSIFEHWFLQFEFPDKNGGPYKTNKGPFDFSESLKKDIPSSWKAVSVGDILIENKKSDVQVGDAEKDRGDIPFFTSGTEVKRVSSSIVKGTNIYMSTGGNAVIKLFSGEASYSTDTWCINAGNYTYYLFFFLSKIQDRINDNFFAGSGLKHLQKDQLKRVLIAIPDSNTISKFNKICEELFEKIAIGINENYELGKVREYILNALVTGQIVIHESK